MEWEIILKHTKFADQADCLAKNLYAAGVTTLLQVENTPAKLGHVCGVDIYSVVAEIRRVFAEGIPEEEPEPEVEEEFEFELDSEESD